MRVAVIVGRFQVPVLTEAHRDLLSYSFDKYDRTIIFLGESEVRNTRRNPFNVYMRSAIIRQYYDHKNLAIAKINDMPCDKMWSRKLDLLIKEHINYGDTVTLIGGRDSFIDVYDGEFNNDIDIFETDIGRDNTTGTQLRDKLAFLPSSYHKDYLLGVLHSAYYRYPVVYSTVDVAVIDWKRNKLLVGHKKGEIGWRFPGGFVDVSDLSLKYAAARELSEETGLSLEEHTFEYVGNTIIDDPRYDKELDKIVTHLYQVPYTFGDVRASDDLDYVEWVDLCSELESFVPSHRYVAFMLSQKLEEIKNEK